MTTEVQDSILFKTDTLSIQTLENLKKENKELQTIFCWLEEYSTIKMKQKDSLIKLSLSEVLAEEGQTKIPLAVLKKYFKNEIKLESEESNGSINLETYREDISYLNFSEDAISRIEDSTFDIFKLESDIGRDNILSTISCYIFTTMGFYSLIEYDKFEAFIQAIARGYVRENHYHNVTRILKNINTGFTCC